ncbi:ABC transporter permease [Adlercreutzia equolifaciens]|uniref:ABC transporter permease n=1 Tax=Adlercreutzia equolifaciens TaxID=446660 RepID=UPI0023B0A7E8|nr:FtsX-like permease family protein [Adlercreutzia equolifaciens]MDE8701459.1 ABC transporter permease [Adlercreutzia equolifaciens]
MFYLAWRNITRRLGASVLTAFIAFVAVFMVTASLLVVSSLENGVRLSRDRLGADIMVLPAGASGNTSEVLFCAEPVNVYLPTEALDEAAAVSGVAQVTPQFFTQTVDESCCSVVGVTRIVGIDPATDFVLAPWIVGAGEGGGSGESAESAAFGAELGDRGILLGAAAPAIEGGQASILGEVFQVAGALEPTGTSVDETIFMDIEAARAIAAQSPYLTRLWADADPFEAVSCLMVSVDDGADAATVAQELMAAIPGSVAVRTSDMVASVSSQLTVIEVIALVFLVMLVLLAVVALAGRFAALASSRMGELGLLRTLGVSRGRVGGSFALEIGLVTLAAAVVAVMVACAVSGEVVGVLHHSFSMPGAVVPAQTYGTAVAAGLLFAVALSAVALVQPLVRMMRHDPQEILARGDLS